MYTESFLGDVDSILARMASVKNRQFIVTLPENKGKGGYYGLSKAQTDMLAGELLTIARAFMGNEIDGAVIFVDEQNRLVARVLHANVDIERFVQLLIVPVSVNVQVWNLVIQKHFLV